jgi:hypothetical protein
LEEDSSRTSGSADAAPVAAAAAAAHDDCGGACCKYQADAGFFREEDEDAMTNIDKVCRLIHELKEQDLKQHKKKIEEQVGELFFIYGNVLETSYENVLVRRNPTKACMDS